MTTVSGTGEDDDWEGWSLTEPPAQRARPPPLPSARQESSAPSRCASACSKSSVAESVSSNTSYTSSGVRRPKWEQRALQDALSTHLSVSRRQRCVQETLEAVRSAFNPAEGLAAAAAVASKEVKIRTPREQQERVATLATPRDPVPRQAAELGKRPFKMPSAELSERVRALSQPRAPKPCEEVPCAFAPLTTRSASEQRRRSSMMAKPKAPRFELQDLLDELAILQAPLESQS